MWIIEHISYCSLETQGSVCAGRIGDAAGSLNVSGVAAASIGHQESAAMRIAWPGPAGLTEPSSKAAQKPTWTSYAATEKLISDIQGRYSEAQALLRQYH